MQKMQLIGNLGGEPESRVFPDGGSICKFSVATSRKWKDKTTGEPQEKTTWHNIKVGGKLAPICQEYLSKGSKVYIEGELDLEEWDNKETGVKMSRTVIKGYQMEMLSPRQDGGNAAPQRPTPPQHQAPQQTPQAGGGFDGFDSDIPF